MNFKKMSLADKKKLFLNARDAYYNQQRELITDAEFDKLEDLITAEDPTWKPLKETGAKVDKNRRLVHFMPSLNKMYEADVSKFFARVKKWQAVEKWVVLDKLDGTSLQLVYENGKPTILITRGDGIEGRDVSHFISALVTHRRIPAFIVKRSTVVLRLEAVMQQKVFEKKYSREVLGDKLGQDNARQMANGQFLRKTPGNALADIDLNVLSVYGEELLSGLRQAAMWNFDIVRYTEFDREPAASELHDMLVSRRVASPYAMDGLVVTPAKLLMEFENSDKPKYSIAFKVNDEENAVAVKVLDVVYEKTRLGRWSAVIEIQPTRMEGVTVSRATAHNGAWMLENGIGPGAVVKVLRSGGVIPKIVGIVKKAEFKQPPGQWEMRGRFLHVVGEVDKATRIRRIHFFMTTLGIELLAEKTLDKLYEVGFKSVDDYVHASKATGENAAAMVVSNGLFGKKSGDRTTIETRAKFLSAGVGEKQTAKIMTELHRVLQSRIPLRKLMIACGHFDAGMGEKKLAQLEDAGISMRELCNKTHDQIVREIPEIHGFSDKTAQLLADGVSEFRKWYKPMKALLAIDGELPSKEKREGKWSKLKISFTGYRSKEQETEIEFHGGSVVTFGAKTDILLYDPKGKPSTKVAKAGQKAMTWKQFLERQ